MEAEAGLALRNSDQVECADLHKCPLCRAHRQAEWWLLFLDFNGGGVVAGWGGCASCYNQQQLRHSGFLQTFRRRRHARKVRQSRAGSSHRAGQGSDVRADTRLAAAYTLPVPPADI